MWSKFTVQAFHKFLLQHYTTQEEFLVNAGTFGMIVFASGVSHVKKKGVLLYDGLLAPLLLPPHPPSSSSLLPAAYVVAWSGLIGQIHVFSLLAEMCAGDSFVTPLHTLCVLSAHYLYITLAYSLYTSTQWLMLH